MANEPTEQKPPPWCPHCDGKGVLIGPGGVTVRCRWYEGKP